MLSVFSRLSAFQRVLLGLFLGIAFGLFFGELAAVLDVVGKVYVRLLQMTVLPYLLVSIVGGLGRLNGETAAKIGARAGLMVLFLWLATMCTNLLLPLAYPNWESASFFSASMVETSEGVDFLQLYIPSNIFASLSNTIVPAVVLFCILFGTALIQIKNKDLLLQTMATIADGLMKMASFVARLAPLGIFAISASAAGTLDTTDLGRLQVFLWAYLGMWLLMVFVALPLFISWATPFNYSDIRKLAGEAMVTAFATGTVLVVLPMIAERCKALLAEYQLECEETDSVVDVMVPTAYSFPSVGTLMGLGFILFSGWYLGTEVSITQYPSYVLMGTLVAFGSMPVAIPFLLDYFSMPSDQFQLYLLGSVVTARFATAMAALHGFVICLLVASAVLNKLKWRQLFNALGVHLLVSALALTGLGLLLGSAIKYDYTQDKAFEALRLMNEPVEVIQGTMQPLAAAELSRPRLAVIKERGTLRVGYSANNLPFAFRNNHGEIIGFDMDIFHALARDLGVALEIHKIEKGQMSELLNSGVLDIIGGGSAITPDRALQVAFAHSSMFHTLGLVVPDSVRDEFASYDSVRKMEALTLAVPALPYYVAAVERAFPNATVVPITTPRPFFRGEQPVDALMYSIEAGSAWTLLYPEYSVVLPEGLDMKAPAGYALPLGQHDFVHFLNTWMDLKKSDGFKKKLYEYWILGKNPDAQESRWSVIKDVLHWVE